ncbi:hypothetical protein ACIPY0_17070 [Paenarthrobacter nicotinovorans]|jgi:hypothetical protein|uniref:hypothetical protein n=1 Tax=Paenarthrobacter nicotinovorans TaxID=29320 RepID=UPI003814C5EC
MNRIFNASTRAVSRRMGATVLVLCSALLLTSCESWEEESKANPAEDTSPPAAQTTAQTPIISADGLYQLMPDFHCRDDGPDSEDNRCLTMECPPTAVGEPEGRPVIWKRAPRTIPNPDWQDWIPVTGPVCFYDPHA